MALTATPHLMFTGEAEQAMQTYITLFKDAEIIDIQTYQAGEPGPEGTVKRAVFSVGGQRFNCTDSPIKHDFSFTPSFSIFVDFDNEAEQSKVFASLSEQGTVLMPLDNYGFSARFGWLNDKFGVSWQLNLP